VIPLSRPAFGEREARYAAAALESTVEASGGRFAQRAVQMLERLLGGGEVMLTTSCTHALELASRVLGLGVGDEVIVPAFTFVTTASAMALNDATPVFADVRADTLNVDLAAVEAAITPRTRAICIVHYAGVAAEPDRFAALADRHGLALVEDNAHGLSGQYRGKPLGRLGQLAALSFDYQKNVSCGQGGALVVNDGSRRERAQTLMDKGTDLASFRRGEVSRYTWVELGSNFGLAEVLAGVLVAQLERIDEIQQRRLAIWARYADELSEWAAENGVALPCVPPECTPPAHQFHLLLPTRADRDGFVAQLEKSGVQAPFHFQALNTSAMGQRFGGRKGQCPVAEQAADRLVRIPLFPGLTDSEQDQVVDAVRCFRVSA
jgi:dTDP-4-amino-4,6-dideoxygalactose transaminase